MEFGGAQYFFALTSKGLRQLLGSVLGSSVLLGAGAPAIAKDSEFSELNPSVMIEGANHNSPALSLPDPPYDLGQCPACSNWLHSGKGRTLAQAEATREEQSGPGAKELDEAAPERLSLPYAFYNDNFGFAGAWIEGVIGLPEQPQARLLGTVMAGTQGSAMGFLAGNNIRVGGVDRLFLDPVISIGYFDETDAYIDGDPGFPDERAGSNGSDEDNFVTGKGWDNFFRLKFKYLLPIGSGREIIDPKYELDRGILVGGASGGESMNPLESGRTFAQLRPFYRNQQIDGDFVDEDITTNGLDFDVFWDNRDFPANPSKGQGVLLKVSRDFGLFDSDESWTNLEAEVDQYFDFGKTDTFRQRVLALGFWTAYSPTWDENPDGSISNRPPAYTGATLGGLWRMRAFPAQRFNDKAAIYYAAELRMIPDWNPFDKWPALQKHVGVQWLQFVPFLEAGRVADEWDLGEFHSSMKWDAGFGVRAMAKGFVVRADTAYSEEGVGVQMMINQPFQF